MAAPQSDELLLPADVTASGFYVTNANNRLVGNAASGGWAGFAFPELPSPVKLHRHLEGQLTPSARPILAFDGNSAHSSSFWWSNAGAIYFGGKLWHANSSSDELTYNAGRQSPARETCATEPCALRASCSCPEGSRSVTRVTNTKVFLTAGTGLTHWGARPEVVGYEAHDVGLSLSILGDGYIHEALVRCRTGAALQVPCDGCDASATLAWGMGGTGFEWYDTNQVLVDTAQPQQLHTPVTLSPCMIPSLPGSVRAGTHHDEHYLRAVRRCAISGGGRSGGRLWRRHAWLRPPRERLAPTHTLGRARA